MSRRSSSLKDTKTAVNRGVGSSYDTVKIVADNIDVVIEVADNIDNSLKYLGGSTTPPSTRLDGSPIEDGDYFLDTGSNTLVYYNLSDDVWFEVDPAEAINARDEAIDAKNAAELAESNASTSESNASTSEANAATSETNAKTSETNADNSANNAATYASNASGSATDANDSAISAANSASSASSSKNLAETAATTATSKASAAGVSESSASSSAASASDSASAASTSEGNAATSEANALVHANNASAAFDNFDDKYLGAKASDPALDNDGDTLQVGSSYWNSTEEELKYWNGAVWESPEATATQSANTATLSAINAATSESNAATSESNASASASTAVTKASEATDKAAEANTHAVNASNSADIATDKAAEAAALVQDIDTGNIGKTTSDLLPGNDYNNLNFFGVNRNDNSIPAVNPPFGSTDVAPVLNIPFTETFGWQLSGHSSSFNRMAFRAQAGGVFQPWTEVFGSDTRTSDEANLILDNADLSNVGKNLVSTITNYATQKNSGFFKSFGGTQNEPALANFSVCNLGFDATNTYQIAIQADNSRYFIGRNVDGTGHIGWNELFHTATPVEDIPVRVSTETTFGGFKHTFVGGVLNLITTQV